MQISIFFIIANRIPGDASSSTSGLSASSGDLKTNNYKEPSEAVSKWNPFEDTFTYEPTMEEDLFGAEFDKIRQEGEINLKFPETSFSFLIVLHFNRHTIAGTITRLCNT